MNSTRTKSSINELYRAIGENKDAAYIDHAFLKGVKCNNSIWPNLLFDLAFDLNTLKALLPEILREMEGNSLPEIIVFDPETDHSDCIHYLKEQGFRHGTWQGMTADLTKTEELNEELEIFEPKELEHWIKCVESTLMNDKRLDVSIFKKLQEDPSVFFLEGRLEGTTVSTSMVFLNGKSAGLFLVSTKEHYRKRGFGKAITIASKNLAYLKGCSEMYLHSTPIAESTYSACGFARQGVVDVFNLGKKRSTNQRNNKRR